VIETLKGSLSAARSMLSEFMPPHEADREARLILCHALGLNMAQLMARLDGPWPAGGKARIFLDALKARRARQPLAQILGVWSFYGRAFETTAETLTPRPDTESLIEIALQQPFRRLLDLGTGTGAIAVTLLAERPAATGLATDISDAALAVATRNAGRHEVADRMTLQQSDWWGGVDGLFDLIVSNPPYVSENEYAALAPEITRWEPRGALTPGGDGLSAYREIARGMRDHLAPGGRCLLEIGEGQGADVSALLRAAGLEDVTVHPDINGKDRVVSARAPAP